MAEGEEGEADFNDSGGGILRPMCQLWGKSPSHTHTHTHTLQLLL